MERTLREFLDTLKEEDILKEIGSDGTKRETQEWLLEKFTKLTVMIFESDRLLGEIERMELDLERLVNSKSDINEMRDKIRDLRVQYKSLNVLIGSEESRLYNVIMAKFDDVFERMKVKRDGSHSSS